MIKVKLTVGTNSSEAEVWRARYNGDGTASLYTGLDESKRIVVNKGNIVTLDPLDAEDSIVCMKMYGNGDLKNICEEIQTRMVCKLMESDTSGLITFAQISEICQPAFGINAKNLGRYKLEDDVNQIAEQCGFELFAVERLRNHRRPHAQLGMVDNSEKIFCFQKIHTGA